MRTLRVTLLAAIVTTILGVPMFMHPPLPYTGVQLHLTGAWVQPDVIGVEPQSPAYRAGLRSGDVISCLSVRDAQQLINRSDFHVAYAAGTPIDLCVNRAGG